VSSAPSSLATTLFPSHSMNEKANEKYKLFAQTYLAFKLSGLTSAQSYEKVQLLGYPNTHRQLYNQIALLEATGNTLTRVKTAGCKPLLKQDQIDELYAWVLAKNEKNEEIGRRHVQAFCHEAFGIKISVTSVGELLARLKLTLKRCRTKTTGFLSTKEILEKEYYDWILKMRGKMMFFKDPDLLRSVDVTHTRQPAQTRVTFSPLGSGPQFSKNKTLLYTDAIVTMVSADGKNHTPCLLFTFNPRLAPVQKDTPRGRRLREELLEALMLYEITEDRIVYTKSNKHFRGESAEIYKHFFNYYDVPKDALILHDGGKAYKERKTSIFDSLGFPNHVAYPSRVHQWLSPNDNNLHGCKTTWKEEYFDFGNEISAPLRLMQLIDCDTVKHSKYYFERNMLHVTELGVGRVIMC